MSLRAVEIRAPAPGDLDDLLAHIRPADLAEGEALAGPGAVPSLVAESMERSPLLWTMASPAGVVCIFGAAPATLMGDKGMPWMVGTHLVEVERRALMRLAPAYIARMLAAFPLLVNVVDARNRRSIAFLRRLGFIILPAMSAGVASMPFHPFVMEA